MATVISAIVGFLGAYGSWVVAALTVASTVYTYLTQEDPSRPASVGSDDPGTKFVTRNTQAYLPIVYGKAKVSGNDMWIGTRGEDSQHLYIIQSLSEGECDGIETIDGQDQVWVEDTIESEYGTRVEYWFHNGAADQTADTNITDRFPEANDNYRHVCYIAWHFIWNLEWFQGFPVKRHVVLKGRKLYDFRTETTAWSQNAVLALYDYMTNALYGLGKPASVIDVASWTSAANYFDTKGWVLNLVVLENETAQDIINRILAHFRGSLVWYDGKFYLRYADLNYESSCKTLGDEHISHDSAGKALISITQASRARKPDGLRVKIIDPDKNYTADNIPVGEAEGNIKELKLLGASKSQAMELGTFTLERRKLDRQIIGIFRGDAVELEPHDVITLNTSALSIANQLMRVESANFLPTTTQVELTLIYESSLLYDLELNLTPEGVYECEIPDWRDEPPPVENANISEESYDYRGRSFTRLLIDFDPPSDYELFDHVEVWQSENNTNFEHLFNTTTSFEIPNVEEGRDYYIRLMVVNVRGIKQQDNNAYTVYRRVSGNTSVPTSLSTLEFMISDNGILSLYAYAVDDPDIEIYEFRHGQSWVGGILLGAFRAPNMTVGRVKPGSHTFFANTYLNNGNYGETPVSVSLELPSPPPGYSVVGTETDSYAEGTHDNTQRITYDSEWYLRVIHVLGGSLSGTYTSKVWDRGSSGRYLVYFLADIVLIGAGNTWEDKIDSATTWNNLEAGTKTWNQIWEITKSSKVKINLLYGDTSPPANKIHRMEMLAAEVTGRYFQVEIEIEDEGPSVYSYVQNYELKFCQ